LNGPLNNLYLLTERITKTQREIEQLIHQVNFFDYKALQDLSRNQLRRIEQLSQQLSILSGMVQDFRLLQDVMHQSKVDVRVVLERVIDLCRCDLSVKYEVQFELDLAKDLPLVHIPGSKLVPSFMHLCQNAINAVRQANRKIVTVECRKEPDTVRVTFRSSGREPSPDQNLDPFLQLYYRKWPEKESAEEAESKQLWLCAVQELLGPYGVKLLVQAGKQETATTAILPVSAQR
jgi:two-component system, NtrC family, sensor kinase